MKIPVSDFRWYAAFHDEGHHPHIHMMAWSAKAGQAYLSKDGIKTIKSKLTKGENTMKKIYFSFDELSVMLTVPEVAAVLGISRASAYELAHSKAIEESKGLDVVKAGQYTVGQWMEVWFENFAKIKVDD